MSRIVGLLKRSLPFLVFGDSGLSVLGHPYALARTGLKSSLRSLASVLPPGPLLDIGCGSMPYRNTFKLASPYHGLEIDQQRNRENPLVDYFYNGKLLPFPNSSYSVIFSSQVLEHSFEPELLLSECSRVLKPDGMLLLTIPFMWPEHEKPWDSQRFTSFGLINRLEKSGFSIVSVNRVNPRISALLQLLIEWNESVIRPILEEFSSSSNQRLILLVWRVCLAIPYTLLNLLGVCYRSLPFIKSSCNGHNPGARAPEMFLDLVVLAKLRNHSSAPPKTELSTLST